MPSAPCPDDRLAALLPRIAARAHRLSRDRDAAQDLAQETALRLWQRLNETRDVEDLEAYAMITLRNLATSGWRKAKPVEDLRDDQATCPPDALRRLAVADLMTAIDRLPADQAHLMRLVAGGETSPAALSQCTGLPTGTVMSRLGRARRALRDDLDLPQSASVAALI